MTPEQIFDAWAPPEARWSRWAKPVLFAHLDGGANPHVLPPQASDPPAASFQLGPIPPGDGSTAVVIDLPSATGVTMGLRLAEEKGYRPVPLYNAVPAPFKLDTTGHGRKVAVDMADLVAALSAGAERLAALHLAPDAPPAFLLDARRRGEQWGKFPGSFDNRSVSLPTDFPSATFLLAHGVRQAMLIQLAGTGHPQADLSHTLRRWQDAKIDIVLYEIDAAAAPRPIEVHKPSWFGHVWHNLLVRAGLRRNPMGGFGGYLPVPSSGGSHGGFG